VITAGKPSGTTATAIQRNFQQLFNAAEIKVLKVEITAGESTDYHQLLR